MKLTSRHLYLLNQSFDLTTNAVVEDIISKYIKIYLFPLPSTRETHF